jgi:hypothetical protein
MRNKFQCYVELEEWIYAGPQVANAIYDSPFQRPEYAPYVVEQLLKKTPLAHIPGAVLQKLREELLEENVRVDRPRTWLQRLLKR